MSKFLQVWVSAESKKQADEILDSLLKKKLVAGGLIVKGPARFWWKGKISSMNYYNISAFSITKNKKAIISEVKKVSNEEIPMIWFINFDGNKEFVKWIDRSVE